MFPPGRLIFSMGRPESRRKTTSRQISARERLIRSLLKEERWSYLTCDPRNSSESQGLDLPQEDDDCDDVSYYPSHTDAG